MIEGQTSLADFDAMDYLLFDSIDPEQIPDTAEAVAGYIDGRWPTYHKVRTKFPHAFPVAITTTGNDAADVIDCERGDVDPLGAVRWVKKMRGAGRWAPGIYASLDVWPDLLALLRAQGISRDHVRIWTAHWTGTPHRCDHHCDPRFTTRAGATQWVSGWRGRNVDVSMAWRPFFVRTQT
jgi:hypothetical protein